MRHFFQFVETQETTRTLDGVDRSEYSGQCVLVLRVFLQADEFAVQPVKIFVTLDQKVLDNPALTHGRRSFPNRE